MLILNGRVVDPLSGTDRIMSIRVLDGKIRELIEENDSSSTDVMFGERVIDARGLIVMPGLIDMHVHFRDPGQTQKECLETGAAAAVHGGYTTVCTMPNTSPVVDDTVVLSDIIKRSEQLPCDILQISAITKGLGGKELTNMADMLFAGAAGFSDDGKSVMDSALFEDALRTAAGLDALILSHCEDKPLVRDGVMNEGMASKKLSLPGIPSYTEDNITARDIFMAADTGARLHLCHVSTKRSLQLKRIFGNDKITAETCPHYFALCDEDIKEDRPSWKMNPPLRSREDMEAVKEAIKDGTIDVISTDHAPHTASEKGSSFVGAPFGIVGLETAVPLVITKLVKTGIIGWSRMAELMSSNPAKILGIAKGTLKKGAAADITVIDPDAGIKINADDFRSKGRNTPFNGMEMTGRVVYTLKDGKVVYEYDEQAQRKN